MRSKLKFWVVSHSRLQNEREQHWRDDNGQKCAVSNQFNIADSNTTVNNRVEEGGGGVKLCSKELNQIGNPNPIEVGEKTDCSSFTIPPPPPPTRTSSTAFSVFFSKLIFNQLGVLFLSLQTPINTTSCTNEFCTKSYMQHCNELNPMYVHSTYKNTCFTHTHTHTHTHIYIYLLTYIYIYIITEARLVLRLRKWTTFITRIGFSLFFSL